MDDNDTWFVPKSERYRWALEICSNYLPDILAPMMAHHLVAHVENWGADDFEEFHKWEGWHRYEEPWMAERWLLHLRPHRTSWERMGDQMRRNVQHIQRFRSSHPARGRG